MDRYKLIRMAALVLALLVCITALAGCSEDDDEDNTARVCSYCGAEYSDSDEIRHGVGACVDNAPCGVAGHVVLKGKSVDKDGNRHDECELCGEFLCNGKRHGEGICGQEKRGFDDIELRKTIGVTLLPSEESKGVTVDINYVDTADDIFSISCDNQHGAQIRMPGDGYTFTLLTQNGSAIPSDGSQSIMLAIGVVEYRVPLIIGENTFSYMITAENGDNRLGSFKIINNSITPPSEEADTLSGDNTLSTFKVQFPDGTAVDMRDPEVRKSITVADVTSAQVTATPSHGKATVTGDKGNITLAEGENKFRVVVTAENGSKAYFNYTINVTLTPPEPPTPPASSDASLASLSLSAPDHTITLNPAFSSGTYAYNTEVSDLDNLTISATANRAGATVSGDGSKSLTNGSNVFTVTVTAEDGVTQQTYTVTVSASFPEPLEPPASSDASLASLSLSAQDHTINLSPAFSSGTYTYNTAVTDLESLTILATVNHAGATVSGTGIKSLAEGNNEFTLTVIAEGGVTKQNYVITGTATNVPPA